MNRLRASHILEFLDKLGCDLIVMGTYGRSGLKHLLLRSVAEEVVRRVRCPRDGGEGPDQAANAAW